MSAEIDHGRLARLQAKAEEWATQLIDMSPRNPLLHFKDTKKVLELTSSDPVALQALLAGEKTSLTKLFPDSSAHKDACARARALRRDVVLFAEEQGVDIGKVAHGLVVTAPATTTGTMPNVGLRAPLLLRSVEIVGRTVADNDFALTLTDEVELNRVLLHGLDRLLGLDIDVEAFAEAADVVLRETESAADQLTALSELLSERVDGTRVGMRLDESIVLGLFNYEKMPMVGDLLGATSLLGEHDLVAALAGHAPASQAVHADRNFEPMKPDEIAPADEFLVHDADHSQQRAIAIALSGRHLLIEGPPGTGKSQTIANIIAGAAARGSTVLFVAEKRAAIEAVTDRLADAGLDKLVFDLHQNKLDKKQVANQLYDSLQSNRRTPLPEVGDLHTRLALRRTMLREHSSELHLPREPWGLSAYEVQAELADLREYESSFSLSVSTLRALDADTVARLHEDFLSFVDIGGPRVLRKESPWWRAEVTEENLGDVVAQLDDLATKTLRQGRDGLRKLLRQTGLREPADLTGWEEVLQLLDGVHRSVESFGSTAFGTQLDQWWLATASRSERAAADERLSWWKRWQLRKEVRAANTDGITRTAALHTKLTDVLAQRARWRELGGDQAVPAEIVGLHETMRDFEELRSQLASVALCAQLEDVETRPTDEVGECLEELREDQHTLWQMPKITALQQNFQRLGLMPLVQEAADRDLGGEQLWRTFRHCWLTKLLNELRVQHRVLRDCAPAEQDRRVDEFQTFDRRHLRVAADRIRRNVAERVRQARDDYPDETKILKDQASKRSRHMSVRRLVEKTSHVLLSLRPCWAMSPLVVSKTLPAERLFDIVIFDEASQIQPQDAITSIARGSSLVVAGDDKQLPPTNHFQRILEDEETDDEDGGALQDYESILTAMRALMPYQTMLEWHYRSRDERLIAFSNHEIYGDALTTFPGATQEPPVELDVVDGVASPGQDGSAPAEVERVVRRIVEHVRTCPGETLGVITPGVKHRDRVEQALRRAMPEYPELAALWDDNLPPGKRFFLKSLENVQGDERDVIILTVGVAKRSTGKVNRANFGVLNRAGSDRRWNVAVTRAKKRMIMISSFHAHALEPSVDRTGTEMLRRYLEFAERQADITQVGRPEDYTPNGFEADVHRALTERGVPVHPQWGFSGYRIDFALAHRDEPGRMVLAVEADGDRYHRMTSVRDRDRLRQAHLENLGWTFHRVWSSAWFSDREGQTDAIVKAWEQAMIELEADKSEPEPVHEAVPVESASDSPESIASRRGPRPDIPAGLGTPNYSDSQLIEICRWLHGDQLLLDKEERVDQALAELGFRRRGTKIVARLRRAVDIVQSQLGGEDDA